MKEAIQKLIETYEQGQDKRVREEASASANQKYSEAAKVSAKWEIMDTVIEDLKAIVNQ
jgi:flagellar biosynthesis/type III secretory pathway chaperone